MASEPGPGTPQGSRNSSFNGSFSSSPYKSAASITSVTAAASRWRGSIMSVKLARRASGSSSHSSTPVRLRLSGSEATPRTAARLKEDDEARVRRSTLSFAGGNTLAKTMLERRTTLTALLFGRERTGFRRAEKLLKASVGRHATRRRIKYVIYPAFALSIDVLQFTLMPWKLKLPWPEDWAAAVSKQFELRPSVHHSRAAQLPTSPRAKCLLRLWSDCPSEPGRVLRRLRPFAGQSAQL